MYVYTQCVCHLWAEWSVSNQSTALKKKKKQTLNRCLISLYLCKENVMKKHIVSFASMFNWVFWSKSSSENKPMRAWKAYLTTQILYPNTTQKNKFETETGKQASSPIDTMLCLPYFFVGCNSHVCSVTCRHVFSSHSLFLHSHISSQDDSLGQFTMYCHISMVSYTSAKDLLLILFIFPFMNFIGCDKILFSFFHELVEKKPKQAVQ